MSWFGTIGSIVKDGSANVGRAVTVRGWLKSVRKQKQYSFLHVSDGSNAAGIQVVVPTAALPSSTGSAALGTGASVCVTGDLTQSPGNPSAFEIQGTEVQVLGGCDPLAYPLSKKYHSLEFLRSLSHLRSRSNTLSSVFRIRSTAAHAFHEYFKSQGLMLLHAPILTRSDCEGAGEQFQVFATASEDTSDSKNKKLDSDFFGESANAYLTVSAQLHAECFALAFPGVYTFGPTFRAERSFTNRHLAEFWIIEPELAFADLETAKEICQGSLQFAVRSILENNLEDVKFLETVRQRLSKNTENKEDQSSSSNIDLLARLDGITSAPFSSVKYVEAIDILKKSGQPFQYKPELGEVLHTEHEKYLAEHVYKGPVFVTHYPKDKKPFYMKTSNERGSEGLATVENMDLLLPGVAEVAGGSARVDSYDELIEGMEHHGLNPKDYEWYLDLRRFGSVPHAGFGIGFDRFLLYCTGLYNIRDVVPIPRYPGSINL